MSFSRQLPDQNVTRLIDIQGGCEKMVIYQPIISTYKILDKKKILKNSGLLQFIRLNNLNYISASKWAPLLRMQRWTLRLKFATARITAFSLIFLAASLFSLFKAEILFGFWRSLVTSEPRETFWLQQWIGLAIQRGNAFSILTAAAREWGASQATAYDHESRPHLCLL